MNALKHRPGDGALKGRPMAAFTAGVVVAFGGQALLRLALRGNFRHAVRRLNAGDYAPLLATYADDAVLRFNEGPHRWSGDHRGKEAIERFLRNFTSARLRGEILDVWMKGPPWALTLVARFDDHATTPEGEQIYNNRIVIVARTRWGRIVEQEDFYEDTGRIAALEERLQDLGVEPVAPTPIEGR